METNEKLRALIEDNDTSQTELADIIGVHRKQIGRWLRNDAEMGIYKLKEICLYYGVSADYLLGLPDDLEWPRKNKLHKTNFFVQRQKALFFLTIQLYKMLIFRIKLRRSLIAKLLFKKIISIDLKSGMYSTTNLTKN